MRLLRLSALFAFLGLAPAQTLSGLSFDGEDVVSLMWAFDGQSTGRYDFFLCAGDESGSYVSISLRDIQPFQSRNHAKTMSKLTTESPLKGIARASYQ